ncbi:hypothetical protein [Streptomyces paludis]|nr:hypothetical protein [Streptomyces paludis]
MITAIAAVAALGVAGVTAAQAVAAPAGVSSIAVSASSVADDGRAVFAGIFFLQGEVGAELSKSPAFSDPAGWMAENDTDEARSEVGALIEEIQAGQPGFFGEFGDRMRSGDPRKVESALDEAGAVLAEYVAKTEGGLKDVAAGDGRGQGRCVLNVAVAGNVVLALNVVNVANVINKVNLWVAPADQDLSKEETIRDLTQLLAA